jgi:hypothetical protein
MPLAQSIETAREERIGAEGVAPAALNDALGRSAQALDWLRARGRGRQGAGEAVSPRRRASLIAAILRRNI